MRFGINTFLFSCPFTDASTRLFPKFKKWGFDSVEISVEDFAHLDPERFKAQLNKYGLVCGSVTPCLGPDKDLRGTPGNDHIDWKSIAAALRAIRYKGDVVIESFTSDVKALARAAAIWRKLEPTRDEIAWKGLKFLRSILK